MSTLGRLLSLHTVRKFGLQGSELLLKLFLLAAFLCQLLLLCLGQVVSRPSMLHRRLTLLILRCIDLCEKLGVAKVELIVRPRTPPKKSFRVLGRTNTRRVIFLAQLLKTAILLASSSARSAGAWSHSMRKATCLDRFLRSLLRDAERRQVPGAFRLYVHELGRLVLLLDRVELFLQQFYLLSVLP